MTLPVLNIAKQQITIPQIEKTYTIRPYLVGEEKALLMAAESKDEDTINNAVRNLIEACVEENIKMDELSAFETEYLFLQLRKISVNNMAEIGLGHKEGDCNHIQKVNVDLDTVKLKGVVDNKIILDESRNIGVMMKVPSNKMLARKYKSETEKVFGLIESCIESIFDDKNIYHTKEISKEELTTWVNSLNSTQLKKITNFFSNLPSFYFEVEYTCEVCGKTEKTVIEGLPNFL